LHQKVFLNDYRSSQQRIYFLDHHIPEVDRSFKTKNNN
jgi:hypothetical protein